MKSYCLMPGFLMVLWTFFMLSMVSVPLMDAAAPALPKALPDTGDALYRMACAACHGADGRGAPAGMVGFDVPLPDFTDCNFVTREADADWMTVVQEGGPARGFSEIMPEFGDALTEAQIQKILDHIKTFSRCSSWPRGELNLPRALFTVKAFPEDELVFSTAVRTAGLDKVSNKLIYERRFGDRNQFEFVLPMGWSMQRTSSGHSEWTSSLGDVALAYKRVLYHSLPAGCIISAAGEVVLPTGDEDEGFGNGTTIFEPYLAWGQLLPADFFLQCQGGVKVPWKDDRVQDEAFWRVLLGRTFALGRYGHSWSPMVEVLGEENLVKHDDTRWDVVPQLQVSLNRRQHVRLALGVRVPLNHRDDRKPAYMAYLMWDMFDGGLFEGW